MFKKIIFWLIRILLKIIIFPIVRLIWIKQVNGLENIPKNSAAILASNHSSYFDFICLSAISHRPIYFLTAEVFFKKKFWKPIMLATEQIKIDRYGEDKKESAHIAIDVALRKLRLGNLIGIYPEGTRSQDGKIHKAFNGVSKIALASKVPVIPIGMVGTFEIMSRKEKFPHFNKCTINIGSPITYSEYALGDNLDNITAFIMSKISKLVEKT